MWPLQDFSAKEKFARMMKFILMPNIAIPALMNSRTKIVGQNYTPFKIESGGFSAHQMSSFKKLE